MGIDAVMALSDVDSGRFLVETLSGSRHVLDLDANTYVRRGRVHRDPTLDAGPPLPLREVIAWPRLNSMFRVGVGDESEPFDLVSSYVTRITRLGPDAPDDVELAPMTVLEQVATAPPINAWLLIGDDASHPTPSELRAQRDPSGDGLVDWTVPRQIQRGDLAFLYFTASRSSIHFASRALYPPVFDPTIEVNANRVVDSHQWWTDLAPMVAVPAVTFATLQALHGGHLNLRGKPTHYLTPDVVDAIVASFGPLDDEQRLVLQTPVGDPKLPDPATATVADLRALASGALPLERTVEQYVVEPLLRLCLADRPEYTVERQMRIAGAGVVDYGVRHGTTATAVIEVKLGVQRQRQRDGDVTGSPDLAQVLRYTGAADVAAVLIDANDIYLIDRGALAPSVRFERRALTDLDVADIADHIAPS